MKDKVREFNILKYFYGQNVEKFLSMICKRKIN